MSHAADFGLTRDHFGRLLLTLADGTTHTGVIPIRAFPITAADYGIALMSQEGKELLWFEHLAELPETIAALLKEELASREFMPEIQRLRQVSSFATPSTWQVETSRGNTEFILKSEDDIRTLQGGALLISDSNGIQYLIRDKSMLDGPSKRLLGRFM